MVTGLGAFRPELLYVVAFGPGFGESIAVRAPPGRWLLVDSLRIDTTVPAATLLDAEKAAITGLVLTHPHEDHAAGVDELLRSAISGFLGCAGVFVRAPDRWTNSPDAEKQLEFGSVEAALAAICDHWERNPSSKWDLLAGTHRSLGDARVTALYPDAEAVAAQPSDPNRLATPLLVEWKNLRIVLGADLPRAGWTEVTRSVSGLQNHSCLKVAHHGSSGALHPNLLNGSGSRVWLVTPWSRGAGLPRLEDGEGVEKLLEHVDELHLTSLPGSRPRATCANMTRQQALRAQGARKLADDVLGRRSTDLAQGPGAWVVAGFDGDGGLIDLRHGSSAVILREGRSRSASRSRRTPNAGKVGPGGSSASPSHRRR